MVIASAEASSAPKLVRGACGLTTLEATIVDTDGDGILDCDRGHELIVRDELAPAAKLRTSRRQPLLSMLLFADFQLGDEELTLPSRTEWRGHAALLPHMMNAQVKAASAIAERGGPVLGRPYAMAFGLGDLADNGQLNETELVIDVMKGGKLVDPDSGADGYDGPRRDPLGRGDLRSPVAGERILDLANEPFFAHGLRGANGARIPWYAVHGNHDFKVMGHIPHEGADWQRSANDFATGNQKIFTLAPRYRAELDRIRERSPEAEPAFWLRIFDRVKTDRDSVGDVRHGTRQIPPAG